MAICCSSTPAPNTIATPPTSRARFPSTAASRPNSARFTTSCSKAQKAAIDEARPGRPFSAYHDAAVKAITSGLIKLGLLKGSLEKNIREHTYRPFYMHKTGHWLGLDVHDVGDYRIDGEFRELEPGMVVTVEPGIYISPDMKSVPAKWRGIGIRIEDDVVVTRGEPEVITESVPSDPDEIEALMADARA